MAVKLVAVNGVVVFATIFTPDAKLLTADHSQRVTAPVCPLSVKVVEFVPVQTEALPTIVPPTDGEVVVALIDDEFELVPQPLVALTL